MPRVLTDSHHIRVLTYSYHTTPKIMRDKPSFWMTSNDHFTKQISFSYKPKYFWMIHLNDHFTFKTMCLFVGSEFFVSHRRLHKSDTFIAFHHWGLCLTIIGGPFTRGRFYSYLLIPDTYFLFHFIQAYDSVGCCPI